MEQKICKQCQGLVLQRPNESNYRYKQKKYCSQICCRAYMKENKIGWWAAPAVKSKGKPKHKWNDLSIQPYLNNDEIAGERRPEDENSYF